MVTLRVGTAILLSGWLLMYPPLDKSPISSSAEWKVDLRAPISQWEQARAYDSAEACESDRQGRIAMAQDMSSGFPGLPVPPDLSRYSRCVPADLIYQPMRPVQ